MLTPSQVCVDAHVTSSTTETLALAVWDVLLGLGVTVLLRHTKVNNMNDVGTLGHWPPNEEVVWLDITVDEVLLMNRLNTGNLWSCDRSEGKMWHESQSSSLQKKQGWEKAKSP